MPSMRTAPGDVLTASHAKSRASGRPAACAIISLRAASSAFSAGSPSRTTSPFEESIRRTIGSGRASIQRRPVSDLVQSETPGGRSTIASMTRSSLAVIARTVAFSVGAMLIAHQAAPRAGATGMAQAPSVPEPKHFGTWGVDLTAMDRSVKPGDDFDRYVNGAWAAKTEIPADQPSAGVGFDVFNLSQEQIRALIETAPATTPIGAMYKAFMNEAAVDTTDDKSLQVDLKRLGALPDKAAFARFMGQTSGAFGMSLFGPGVAPDTETPAINGLYLGQGGLGLPDRDYYLTDNFKPQLDAYRAYIERTLAMIGDKEPAKTAGAVLAFETAVAKASWAAKDRRDIDKINNPMSVAGLQKYAPGIDWDAFFTAAHLTKRNRVIVLENTAIRDIAALYDQTPLATLKAWEAFHITNQASPYLSKRFVDSRFTFTKTVSGVTTQRPRRKRGATLIDTTLGELLGRTYVETYFPATSKAMRSQEHTSELPPHSFISY